MNLKECFEVVGTNLKADLVLSKVALYLIFNQSYQ